MNQMTDLISMLDDEIEATLNAMSRVLSLGGKTRVESYLPLSETLLNLTASRRNLIVVVEREELFANGQLYAVKHTVKGD